MTGSRGSLSATRVAIIGAGFGGLGLVYRLKQAGFSQITVYEKAAGLGGVWRDNTYPGAACDVPSHLYSFSFAQDFPWSHRFARQPEILAYQQEVARRFDLERHLRFNTEVRGARFDEARARWELSFADGRTAEADILVSAVGQLHHPALPRIPGLDQFSGPAFHSAHWRHDVALRGKRVGVIGTGASAVQFVPEIVDEVAQLQVFQRSPGWVLPMEWLSPGAMRPYSAFEQALKRRIPALRTLDRLRLFNSAELLALAYNGSAVGEALMRRICLRYLHRQIRDPALRRKLTPDYPVGCKRILLTSRWLPALSRPKVEVVTDGIARVDAGGVVTADGRHHALDVLIYGTGFAATDFLAPMQVVGRDGRDLRGGWQSGAEAYLGMTVSGFPNFFMLYGPNTNVGSGSIIFMLEQQHHYITELLKARAQQGWATLELRPEIQAAYNTEIRQRSEATTYAGNCHSWYKTADGRNTNNWVGTMREFRRRTRVPELSHYITTPVGGTKVLG
jgi:cation diffusion facilitator CzcD-associated flavoprotein CzcO